MSIRVLETEDLKKVLKIGEVIEGVRSVYEAKADSSDPHLKTRNRKSMDRGSGKPAER